MSSALFQIIFNPTSAAELAAMPKDLQLQVLGEFRGLPDEVRASGYYGKLQSGVKTLHRYRVGSYRVYFECHDLGVVVHRICSRNTLKDFFCRNAQMTQDEDDQLAENPEFWEMIDEAATREEVEV